MVMTKPYDKDALLNALKTQGIEEGGKVARILVATLADWLRSSAQLSTDGIVGKFDDFAIPGINFFEKLALEKLDALVTPPTEAGNPAPVSDPASAPVVETPAEGGGTKIGNP